mgnify:FL=1
MHRFWAASLVIIVLAVGTLFLSHARASDETFNEAVSAVKSKDYVRAVDLFEPLANAGLHDAQYNLAVLLRRGLGRPQDFRTALKWSWLAQLGDIKRAKKTSEELADMFSDELLVEIREEVRLFLKNQIDQGDRIALLHYGQFFIEIMDEPNYNEAYVWHSIAAAFRIKGSIAGREEIASELDVEMLPELQATARVAFRSMQEAEEKSTSSKVQSEAPTSSQTAQPNEEKTPVEPEGNEQSSGTSEDIQNLDRNETRIEG